MRIDSLHEARRVLIAEAGSTHPLKYQMPVQPASAARSAELMTVKVRYKDPTGRHESPVRYRAEFCRLIDLAASLDRQYSASPLTRRN